VRCRALRRDKIGFKAVRLGFFSWSEQLFLRASPGIGASGILGRCLPGVIATGLIIVGGGFSVIDSRHLSRQFFQIGRGVARDKHLSFVAVPRQGDIARCRTPVLRMIEVGLIEGASLAFVNRARIAMPEILKFSGIESNPLPIRVRPISDEWFYR
jgi:hypothetical protein